LPLQEARRRTLDGFERTYLDHHLRRSAGTLAEVARKAGINPRTLYEKMRRLGLRKEDYR
jgi:DNA-binding NtrC family response regulator